MKKTNSKATVTTVDMTAEYATYQQAEKARKSFLAYFAAVGTTTKLG